MRHLIVGAAFAGALVACTSSTFNVQPEQLPDAVVGQAYEVVITAASADGRNVQSIGLSTEGAFPPGLSLRSTYQAPTAAIVGTPTAAGTYAFTLRATGEFCAMNGCPFGERKYSLVVTP